MTKHLALTISGFVAGVATALFLGYCPGVQAQLAEQPGGVRDDRSRVPRDVSGLSIKHPRIRIVHTTDPAELGGSMYLQQVDPWLGYQIGRTLTLRNFRADDGTYGQTGKIDGILLADGVTRMMDRSHTNSCATCHNVPHRDVRPPADND